MEPKKPITPRTVAEWMTEQLKIYDGQLRQDLIASDMLDQFGEEFVHETDLRNLSIDSRVRAEFHALNPDVIYERWGWRDCSRPGCAIFKERQPMKLIQHLRKGKTLRWEVEINEESVSVTTRQLLKQALFSSAVLRQSLNSANPSQHARAFASLTTPIGQGGMVKGRE
jgi:hypothetical protein